MRVSKRTRYGLRLMFELAIAYGKESISVARIAELEDISPKFLSQIIIPLKGAGLITSERGSRGGHVLARSPEKISVFDVYSVLEGDAEVVDCITAPEDCERVGNCVAREVWCKLQKQIVNTLSSVTLKNMVDEAEKKQGRVSPTYQI